MNSLHSTRETSLANDLINLARICERQQWVIDYLLEERESPSSTLDVSRIEVVGMSHYISEVRERIFRWAAVKCDGNKSKMALLLQTPRSNIYYGSERSERAGAARS